MSVSMLLLIILVIILFGGFTDRFGGRGYGYGLYGLSVPGILLLFLVIWIVTGHRI